MGWPHRMSFSLDDLDFEDVEILDESPGEPIEAPLLPMRDMVMFPRMVAPLLVGRDRSIEASFSPKDFAAQHFANLSQASK